MENFNTEQAKLWQNKSVIHCHPAFLISVAVTCMVPVISVNSVKKHVDHKCVMNVSHSATRHIFLLFVV